jgi:HD domain
MARRLGLDPAVEQALLHVFERWDGKGSPRRLRGEAIAPPARLPRLAMRSCWCPGRRRPLVGAATGPLLASALVRDGAELLDVAWLDDPCVVTVQAEPGNR